MGGVFSAAAGSSGKVLRAAGTRRRTHRVCSPRHATQRATQPLAGAQATASGVEASFSSTLPRRTPRVASRHFGTAGTGRPGAALRLVHTPRQLSAHSRVRLSQCHTHTVCAGSVAIPASKSPLPEKASNLKPGGWA
jgi:hypothetical protein